MTSTTRKWTVELNIKKNTQTLSLFHSFQLLGQTHAGLHGVTSTADLFSLAYLILLFSMNRDISSELFFTYFLSPKQTDRLYIHVYWVS